MRSGRFLVRLYAGWRAARSLAGSFARPALSREGGDVRGFLLHSQLNMSFLPREVGPSDPGRRRA
jgi:hypothetical protein